MQLYPIESHSWVAIDLLDNYRNRFSISANKLGSHAARQLLNNIQQQLNLIGELVDTSFPYYFLVCEHTRWYVSFSHSHEHVAVMISQYPHIGIDVEDSIINEKVATRFFSVDECQWLHSQLLAHQTAYRGLLWRLKECYIKIHQNNDSKLVPALKKNILTQIGSENLIKLAHIDRANRCHHPISFIVDNTVVIGNIQALPCSFIIRK